MNHDEQIVRDFYSRPIGIIWTYDNGDIAVLSWPAGLVQGYYRKSRDVTTDFYGKIISRGNTVMMLLNKK